MTVIIRPALSTDIGDMHAIRLAVHENPLTSTRLTVDDYQRVIGETGRGWVASVEGVLVGFVVADGSTGNLWALFVHPAFERRGYGRLLHDIALTWLQQHARAPLWLTTDPRTRAESFYRAAGWVLVGPDPSGEHRYQFGPHVS